jgi:formate-dependent nitrite reductase cytochrome c552 subunit
MKNGVLFIYGLFIAMTGGLLSCEGDQGPVGPAGPTSESTCIQCHANSQKIAVKEYQWSTSRHAIGGNNNHNATSCAICHTSQGYVERIAKDTNATVATIQDPLPINCYTCHKIHTTYTDADWAFNKTTPVNIWVGHQTLDFGKANLCISCHQSRPFSPGPADQTPPPSVAFDFKPAGIITADSVSITSTRYGTHHGPQGMMLPGLNGYEIPGPLAYENSMHTVLLANSAKNACVTCHMGTVQEGDASGGHTFRVISEDGNINTAACAECHTNANDLNALVDDRQAQIEARLAELEALLEARGMWNPANEQNTKGKYAEYEAGALFNFRYVAEDKSRGVHNFKYANALLVNSIAALQ